MIKSEYRRYKLCQLLEFTVRTFQSVEHANMFVVMSEKGRMSQILPIKNST